MRKMKRIEKAADYRPSSRVQEFKSSRVQEFKSSRVQELKSSEF
jgi:hypothetical protein